MNYFEKMCILCLGRNKNIKNISLQDDDGTVVEEKLEYVLPELVIFKAHIPSNICTDCLKNLNYVHKFKEKCLHNLVSLSNKIKILTAQNKKYIPSENENSTMIKVEDVNLLCETQIEEQEDKIENIEIDMNDTEHAAFSEENNAASFADVYIKEEPKDINYEIDIKEDPLVHETETENEETLETAPSYSSHPVSTEYKSYKCDICHKTYARASYLKKHKRLHTGEKRETPHKCDMCDKTFAFTAGLTLHKRSHIGEKIFKCDMCDKAFREETTLIKHQRVHSEKPYKCDLCPRTFAFLAFYRKHKLIHTIDKIFTCDLCPYTTKKNRSLTRHKKKKHNNESTDELISDT